MMVPGLSEADCQVAGFRFRQMVDEGRQQQVVAGVRPVSISGRAVFIALRHKFGALLVRAGDRLQNVEAVTRERVGSAAPQERGAIA
jgi:hypothetical protein